MLFYLLLNVSVFSLDSGKDSLNKSLVLMSSVNDSRVY